MRRSLAALVLAAVPFTLLSVPTAAEAGTNGCISRREWNNLRAGMLMTRVHRRIGTSGNWTSDGWHLGDRFERRIRVYRTCQADSFALRARPRRPARSSRRLGVPGWAMATP